MFIQISCSLAIYNAFYLAILLNALMAQNEMNCVTSSPDIVNGNTQTLNSFDAKSIGANVSCHDLPKNDAKMKSHYCSGITIYNLSYTGYHEQKDAVVQQYSSLPYPAVTNEALAHEKKYYGQQSTRTLVEAYGEMRKKPFRVNPGTTLESINHFLFKGKNHFR